MLVFGSSSAPGNNLRNAAAYGAWRSLSASCDRSRLFISRGLSSGCCTSSAIELAPAVPEKAAVRLAIERMLIAVIAEEAKLWARISGSRARASCGAPKRRAGCRAPRRGPSRGRPHRRARGRTAGAAGAPGLGERRIEEDATPQLRATFRPSAGRLGDRFGDAASSTGPSARPNHASLPNRESARAGLYIALCTFS